MPATRSPVHTLKISISGVRGVVGESLTPQLVMGFAQAFGCYVEGGIVLVGRDTRQTGEMVRSAVVGGLLASGCYVIDLGVVPVPTVLIAVKQLQADGAIAITASHNPAQWNALKFARSDGVFLNSFQATELLDVYHQGEFHLAKTSEISRVDHDDAAIERHIRLVREHTDLKAIRARKPHVVVDTCHGAGARMSPQLLRRLGCKVTVLHGKPDGLFPHDPEPIAKNLGDLCRKVREVEADIGFAQDADADRLAVVSEKGKAIGEEFTLAFACDAVCARSPGLIVTNVSTSRMIDEVAARHGGRVLRTKVGEINVVEMMIRERAVVGGEGNGGVIYPQAHPCRDSMIGMALILEGLARHGTVSRWARTFRPSAMHKTKLECPSVRIQHAMAAARRRYEADALDLTDGLKVLWPETGCWLHIRPSNTEPVIRVIAECDTPREARALCEDALATLRTVIAQ
ncbi:MAG: phosphoglucosamine mutase [Armatimonadetes bacterium]|nr:phosphoglucosamine mutase [Armatimonadota bacterium]